MPRIENDIKLDFKDVLIRPKRSTLSSRSQVSLERTYKFKNSGVSWTGVPIMVSNMDTTGTFEMAKTLMKHKFVTCIHKYYSKQEWSTFYESLNDEQHNYYAITIGISDLEVQKLIGIIYKCPKIKFICVDVANGYSEKFVEAISNIRKSFPDKVIVAGNVVTGEMVEELILAGADIVKVGIGPGSVCLTRKKTGVGYPQLSATIECADSAHGLGGHIITDGGCVCAGDVAKAFGGGADFVMMGGMFAGYDQSGGQLVEENGKKFKLFYGMSSDTAMIKYKGEVAKYRSSEGKTVKVPYRGDVNEMVLDMLGGIRSTCTYVGAARLKELSKRTTFVRVTQQLNNIFK